MVERVHLGVLEAAVGTNAVPAFPDGGGALGDGVEPGWVFLAHEQIVGDVEIAKPGQHGAEIGGADETGGQLGAAAADVGDQAAGSFAALLLGQEVKGQGEYVGRLRVRGEATGGGDELALKSAAYVRCQLLVLGFLAGAAEHCRRLREQRRRIGVKRSGDQVGVGEADLGVAVFMVERQPIAKVEADVEEIFLVTRAAHVLDPLDHAVELLLEDARVAVALVHRSRAR